MTTNVWNHLGPDGMATNNDPVYGGIVDKAIVSGEWFVIFNNDALPNAEGFSTKDAALKYLNETLVLLVGDEPTVPAGPKI